MLASLAAAAKLPLVEEAHREVGVQSPAAVTYMANLPSQWSGSSSTGRPHDIPHSGQPAAQLDISDYVLIDEAAAPAALGQQENVVPQMVDSSDASQSYGGNLGAGSSSSSRSGAEGAGAGERKRIAFRTRSEVEILDDGFKWRKYGKKTVKNNPNPRNYYRCSTEGCSVKKRVERDREDPSYVITTYEGAHNHTTPGVVYYATRDSTSGRFYVAGCQIPPSS